MNDARVLICRPLGGLNDILCQIQKACSYADAFGRTVLVDTEGSGAHSLNDDFSNYFVSRSRRLILNLEPVRDRLDRLDVHPAFIKGRVSRYAVHFEMHSGFIEDQTAKPVTFDFQHDHPQEALVHHRAGGGTIAIGALMRLRLHDTLTDSLLVRLRAMPAGYTGVHIRHTDYRSNYVDWLREAKDRLPGPIFLATDNRQCLADCQAAFGAGRVYSFSSLPDRAGEPIHWRTDRDGAFERNSDAILDLLMLALARDYHFMELQENVFRVNVSGFSLLAGALREFRPALARLIDRPDTLLAGLCD